MKYLMLLFVIAVGLESLAVAYDIPAPGSGAKPPVQAQPNPGEAIKKLAAPQRFAIQTDEKATVARLVIPNSIVRALQAEGAKSGSFAPANLIDDQPTMTRTGTVVGGTLLALAALLAGLWMVRERKSALPSRIAIAFLISMGSIGTASLVYANAGPPPESRSLTSKVLKYAFASGEVQVETSNDSDQIVLIVPLSK